MKYKYKKIKIIIGILVIFLIVTNPSLKDFKEYKGISPVADENLGARRTHNFILFSIYQQATEDNVYYDVYYIGVAANFINIAN